MNSHNLSILDSDAQSLPQGTFAIKAGPQTVMSQWVVTLDDGDVEDDDEDEDEDEEDEAGGEQPLPRHELEEIVAAGNNVVPTSVTAAAATSSFHDHHLTTVDVNDDNYLVASVIGNGGGDRSHQQHNQSFHLAPNNANNQQHSDHTTEDKWEDAVCTPHDLISVSSCHNKSSPPPMPSSSANTNTGILLDRSEYRYLRATSKIVLKSLRSTSTRFTAEQATTTTTVKINDTKRDKQRQLPTPFILRRPAQIRERS